MFFCITLSLGSIPASDEMSQLGDFDEEPEEEEFSEEGDFPDEDDEEEPEGKPARSLAAHACCIYLTVLLYLHFYQMNPKMMS